MQFDIVANGEIEIADILQIANCRAKRNEIWEKFGSCSTTYMGYVRLIG